MRNADCKLSLIDLLPCQHLQPWVAQDNAFSMPLPPLLNLFEADYPEPVAFGRLWNAAGFGAVGKQLRNPPAKIGTKVALMVLGKIGIFLGQGFFRGEAL